MRSFELCLGLGAALFLAAHPGSPSSHREAPISALDHKADITDLYAFVNELRPESGAGDDPDESHPDPGRRSSPRARERTDALPLRPANLILYEIRIDNNRNAVADVIFQFRFQTEYQLPDVYTAAAGFSDFGLSAPGVPPRIEDFQNPGLNLRQTYRVTMIRGNKRVELENEDGSPFFAVPGNAGPRTMNYGALFDQATYHLDGVSVFAGTTDDAFWIDLGAAFDTANFRTLGSGVPGVLTNDEDMAQQNFASDTVSGYAVNSIAIEVPIEMLTRRGEIEPADSPDATIGVWGTTSRRRNTIRRSPGPVTTRGEWRQVQRMGNPLINELLIGIGFKDRFSMDQPKNDAQFAGFFLNPPSPPSSSRSTTRFLRTPTSSIYRRRRGTISCRS